MRTSLWLFALTAVATETACVKPVNTVPAPVAPTAQVQYYDLELPADLEIKAVDFSATTYADVSGPPEGAVGSTVSGRAFVNVYAVHRTTGEQFLVLYEDVGRRSRPVQIIRFVPGTDPARP
jgi:hypothetical protein